MTLNTSLSGPPGPRHDEGRDAVVPASANEQPDDESSSHQSTSSFATASQQVSWWEVHQYRGRVLKSYDIQTFPIVGTPAWCALPDGHPVKLVAALDAAQHWALRLDTAQAARCQAAQNIAGSTDWKAVAKSHREHSEFLAANPWARRVIA